MAAKFKQGQFLGENDLSIVTHVGNKQANVYSISYAIYDMSSGAPLLMSSPEAEPVNPSIGFYYANYHVDDEAPIGDWMIRWAVQEQEDTPEYLVEGQFQIVDLNDNSESPYGKNARELIRLLRVQLRDNNPDRNYHFLPPTRAERIQRFTQKFGYLWEDSELYDYLMLTLGEIAMSPPAEPELTIGSLMDARKFLLIDGAAAHACAALTMNWVADEFDYSLNGVSLNLEKSGKYHEMKGNFEERFRAGMEGYKRTLKYTKGLTQSKYGAGRRYGRGAPVAAGRWHSTGRYRRF